jgi:DNA alkylation repair enzyme.
MRQNVLLREMMAAADPDQVAGLSRFFKTGRGEYGEGDLFLGIKVPVTRGIVKSLWKQLAFEDLEECIVSPYHEVRLSALLSLVQIFSHSKKDEPLRKRCVDFYLAHTEYINNWDLVD